MIDPNAPVVLVPGRGTRDFLYATACDVDRDLAMLSRDQVVGGDLAAALITLLPTMIEGQGMRLAALKRETLANADRARGRDAVNLFAEADVVEARLVHLRALKAGFHAEVSRLILIDEAKRRRITVEELQVLLAA